MDDNVKSDRTDSVSRRRFLRSLGVAGGIGAVGPLLAACGGESDSSGTGGESEDTNAAEDTSTAETTASADCSDLSNLSDAQKEQRKRMVESLEYVDQSPKPKQFCGNCQHYVQEEYQAGCGGCALFPGPVNAEGYCNSWVQVG